MLAETSLEERVLFSPDLPEAVNTLLQAAVVANHVDRPRAEELFKQAQALDATCLQTYFALYKFYFYQGRLAEAESQVLAALEVSASQGGFPADFRVLGNSSEQWHLDDNDIGLFYLYSLKALGFIKLRLEQGQEAEQILMILKALDPEDRSGGSVVMQLAQALNEESL